MSMHVKEVNQNIKAFSPATDRMLVMLVTLQNIASLWETTLPSSYFFPYYSKRVVSSVQSMLLYNGSSRLFYIITQLKGRQVQWNPFFFLSFFFSQRLKAMSICLLLLAQRLAKQDDPKVRHWVFLDGSILGCCVERRMVCLLYWEQSVWTLLVAWMMYREYRPWPLQALSEFGIMLSTFRVLAESWSFCSEER